MRKIKLIALMLVFLPAVTFAQTTPAELPTAGLTPESSFYFLDRMGEAFSELFTFGAEANARLQTKFAAERVAEIQAMLAEKGNHNDGIEKAKTLLINNVNNANKIVVSEKASGKDVSALAKEIGDEFKVRQEQLNKTFTDAKNKIDQEKSQIRDGQLKDAQKAGDVTKVNEISQQLGEMEDESNSLGSKKDELRSSFGQERNQLNSATEGEEDDNAVPQNTKDIVGTSTKSVNSVKDIRKQNSKSENESSGLDNNGEDD